MRGKETLRNLDPVAPDFYDLASAPDKDKKTPIQAPISPARAAIERWETEGGATKSSLPRGQGATRSSAANGLGSLSSLVKRGVRAIVVLCGISNSSRRQGDRLLVGVVISLALLAVSAYLFGFPQLGLFIAIGALLVGVLARLLSVTAWYSRPKFRRLRNDNRDDTTTTGRK